MCYPYVGCCLNSEVRADNPGRAPRRIQEQGPRNRQDLANAADVLGVTVSELQAALGPPPPNLQAAASILGITLEDLQAVLPPISPAP